MTFISAGEVQNRIMLDPSSQIKYIGIHSHNPYAKSRSVTLGFAGDNCVGHAIASASSTASIKTSLSAEKILELSQELKTKFPNSIINFEESQTQSGIIPTAIKIEGVGHLRQLIKHLVDKKMITEGDMGTLVPRVKQVEKQLAVEKELVTKITQHQTDIIVRKFEPMISSMIAVCNHATVDELKLSQITTPRDLALTLLVDCMQKGLGTILYEQLPTLRDKVETAAKSLHDFYYGNCRLEKELTKDCFTCPTLEKQREVLFKHIEAKLDEAFGSENPSFLDQASLKKVCERRTQLFVKGEALDLFSNGSYRKVLNELIR